MNTLDLNTLRTFVDVATCKSFTHAAERLGLTQSAVTQQIRKLEIQLNATLFHRTKRHVTLSINGELLLDQAKQLLGLNDKLIGLFKDQETMGKVRFGSPEDFATHFLPDILGEFVRSHPNIKLTVHCELTLDLLKGFQKGIYDLIVIKQRPGEIYPKAKALWHENLVWAGTLVDQVSPNQPINLALSPEPCVYRHCAIEALERAGLTWQISYTSPSVAGLIAAAKAGLGITVLPRNVFHGELPTHPATDILPLLEETQLCLLAHPQADNAVLALAEYIQGLIGISNKKK